MNNNPHQAIDSQTGTSDNTDRQEKKLVLIDGSGFMFRAFYSLPPLVSPQGKTVGALYGYVNMILKLRQTYCDYYFLVVLDYARKTFRNQIYSQYKANRLEPPEELKPQFKMIRDANKALNVSALEMEGVEADDIIASYAINFAEQEKKVIIISSDKDIMQLVSQNISMIDPMTDKIIDQKAVVEKFNVQPKQMIDYQAIVGDASDNVPGASGLGPKAAVDLLQNYDDIANIFQNLDEISKINKRRANLLIKEKDNIFLSKQLVTLKKDVELKIPIEELMLQNINTKEFVEFMTEYGFNSVIQRFKHQLDEEQKQIVDEVILKEKKQFIQKTKVVVENIQQIQNMIDVINEQNNPYIAISFSDMKLDDKASDNEKNHAEKQKNYLIIYIVTDNILFVVKLKNNADNLNMLNLKEQNSQNKKANPSITDENSSFDMFLDVDNDKNNENMCDEKEETNINKININEINMIDDDTTSTMIQMINTQIIQNNSRIKIFYNLIEDLRNKNIANNLL